MEQQPQFDRIDQETIIFTIFVTEALSLLEEHLEHRLVRESVPFIFYAARQRELSPFVLAERIDSLELLHLPKVKRQNLIDASHAILCLVVALYKLDLLERTTRYYYDVVEPPTTLEQRRNVKYDVHSLLLKVMERHSDLVNPENRLLKVLSRACSSVYPAAPQNPGFSDFDQQ